MRAGLLCSLETGNAPGSFDRYNAPAVLARALCTLLLCRFSHASKHGVCPWAGMKDAGTAMRTVQLSPGAGLPENPPGAGGSSGAVCTLSEPLG